MNKIIFASIYILTTISAFGQKDVGVKIYQNTDIFETTAASAGQVRKIHNVNFNRFTLALNIGTKKGFSHEVELFIPEISKFVYDLQFPMNYAFRQSTSHEGKASSYSFRYEISKTLTNKTNRLSFLLGAGINPYYVNMEYFPYDVMSVYYVSTKLYGFVFNVTPRLKYRIGHRLSMDVNVPFKIYDLRAEKTRIENPAIPIHQQTTKDYDNIFLEQAYTIRLGLMYRLNN